MSIIKRFLEWIKIKEKLDSNYYKPPLFKEGEIWWCGIGENIGVEINGKSRDFTRPVLIFKKLSGDSFLGIPMSNQNRKGSWYVNIMQKNKQVTGLLSQIRIFSYKRLHSKIGELDDLSCKNVSKAFYFLFLESNKKFPPPIV